MQLDIGWLPVGVIVLIGIGIVIRARVELRRGFGVVKPPSRMYQWNCQALRWIMRHLEVIGWLTVGFVFGSYLVLVLEKFGIDFFQLPFIIPPLRG